MVETEKLDNFILKYLERTNRDRSLKELQKCLREKKSKGIKHTSNLFGDERTNECSLKFR